MAVDDEAQSGGGEGEFDPRFDPAFQRGYRPKPGEKTRTRMRGAPPTAAPAPAAARAASPASTAPPASTATPASAAWEAETVGVADPAPSIDYVDGVTGRLVPVEHAAAAERAAAAEALPPAPGGVPMLATGAGFLDRIDMSPRTNRRMLALWIIGAGFVALGIALYVVSVFTSYTNPTPNSDVSGLVFSQLGWMLAGPLVTVGLATLVTMTLLTALTARRAPTAAPGLGGRGDDGGIDVDDA